MEGARQRDLSFGRSILGIIPKRDFRLNFKRMRRVCGTVSSLVWVEGLSEH